MKRNPRPSRAWRVLIAAVALLLSSPSATAIAAPQQRPPDKPDDTFYTPPNPLPEGINGDVIRWQELPRQFNVRTYLVLYRSENATGEPIAVSGRVLVPDVAQQPDEPRPIVSLASGTRGVGDSCAPSKFQPDYERPLIEPMLQRGWAVAITDYEGLGTPGGHTYVVGRSEGRTVIDAARAATRLPAAGPGSGLSSESPVAFSGYSQGGGGAAWAGQLAPEYAPEMNVVGITAGGVPADLQAVSRQLDGNVGFGFLLMSAFGLDSAYPELDLQSFLNDKGRETYESEQGACVDAVFGHAFQRISDFTTSNPLADPRWQARIEQNRLGTARPQAPTYLFHGNADELIPLEQAANLRDEYCRAGADVSWKTFPGEHVSTLITAAGTVVDYLADRFDGEPPPNDC